MRLSLPQFILAWSGRVESIHYLRCFIATGKQGGGSRRGGGSRGVGGGGISEGGGDLAGGVDPAVWRRWVPQCRGG